jgi:PsbP-like protein
MKLQRLGLFIILLVMIGVLVAGCGGTQSPAVPAPKLEFGWKRYTQESEGFAIALPFNWKPMDFSKDDLAAMMKAMKAENPGLAKILSDQVTNMAAQGVKFFGYDEDSFAASNGFVTNVNVLRQDSLFQPEFDSALDSNVKDINQQLGSMLVNEVSVKRMTISGQPGARLDYSVRLAIPNGSARTISIVQYVVMRDNNLYIVTCTTTQAELADYEFTFDEIGESLWLFAKQ